MYGRYFDMAIYIKELPPIEYLNECFTLDVENGIIKWKPRPLHHFNNKSESYSSFNQAHTGKIAGSFLRSSRNMDIIYQRVKLDSITYKIHRIIFKMFYGYDPDLIDHIDGNTLNNKPENLRSVPPSVNSKNKSLSSKNTSGVNGVKINITKKRYIADLGNTTKSFKIFEEAVVCRKAWEKENNFHPNHGRERNVA